MFVLMIISASRQAARTDRPPRNPAEATGALIGCLSLFVGLYYSARWRMKLAGHTYKIGRQTVAALVFWYSVFAAFIGLVMVLYTQAGFDFKIGAIMIVVWSGVAYVCRRWRQQLQAEERARSTVIPSVP